MRHFQCVIQMACFHHGQNGTENLFTGQPMVGLNPAKNNRRDEKTVLRRIAFDGAKAFPLTDINILSDAGLSRRIDHRPDEVPRVFRRAYFEATNRFD